MSLLPFSRNKNPQNSFSVFRVHAKPSVAAVVRWSREIKPQTERERLSKQARGSAQSGSGSFCVHTQLYSTEQHYDAQAGKVQADVLLMHQAKRAIIQI